MGMAPAYLLSPLGTCRFESEEEVVNFGFESKQYY